MLSPDKNHLKFSILIRILIQINFYSYNLIIMEI